MGKAWKQRALGYEALFEQPTTEETLELMRSPQITGYRTRTITSGEYREVEIYPLYRSLKKRREAREAVTREAQQRLNNRNSARRVMRLIHTNFTRRDLFMTLTYEGKPVAPTMEEARRDIQNYIDRVKRWRTRHGMPAVQYVYVIQFEEEGREIRVHHHVIMSDMDRDEAERIWGRGPREIRPAENQTKRGLAALAVIHHPVQTWQQAVVRVPEPERAGCLGVGPQIQPITRRKRWRRTAGFAAKDIFAIKFPDWQITECQAQSGGLFPGAHIYAQMRRWAPGALLVRAAMVVWMKRRRILPPAWGGASEKHKRGVA